MLSGYGGLLFLEPSVSKLLDFTHERGVREGYIR